ncbi:MAG: FAD-dependent oxidoreductase, partial [Bryobacteraceae bacterium]
MSASRRKFLSAALVGLTAKAERPIAGSFVNDSFPVGHRMRDHAAFHQPARVETIPLVIVGGGVAGLCAAWRLNKRGFRDFVVLEMEPQAGGNSRWGQNEISRYPWAAHYVPVPNKEALLVRELFEEVGLLKGGNWDDRALCFDPQERLFLHGRWQEGIEPELAATPRDRDQYRRFYARMKNFRASGEFTIPMEIGAKPGSPLDRLSIENWLAQEKFDSPYLRWYVNYACRDDYGALAKDTSAWAGIHYFASRAPEDKGPLTWPEGNGWITQRLLERIGHYVRTAAPVYRITHQGHRLRVFTEDTAYDTEAVIFAAPTFLAHYVLENAPPAEGFVYSPWLTANLTLDRWPRESGIEPAWDNVLYDSPALGYVVDTHMTLRSVVDRTVWTYYWSLAERSPADSRRLLLEKDWSYWRDAILNDLGRAHPDIRQCVSRIDVMRIGHAMARPIPGFLNSGQRRRWTEAPGNIFFANS